MNEPMSKMWLTLMFESTALILENPERYRKEDLHKIASEYRKLSKEMQTHTLNSLMNEAVRDAPETGKDN